MTTNAIVFDLALGPVEGVERFCPDFSREYKKAETIASKRADWIADDWKHTTAAVSVQAIVMPSPDVTVDTKVPATKDNLLSFIGAITAAKQPVVCEHFHLKSAILLAALFRLNGSGNEADDFEVTTLSHALYELRRKQLDNLFPFLDGKFNECTTHVHNVIRAMRLDDLSNAGLCAFAGLPNTATRLTVQRKLAHRLGIITATKE